MWVVARDLLCGKTVGFVVGFVQVASASGGGKHGEQGAYGVLRSSPQDTSPLQVPHRMHMTLLVSLLSRSSEKQIKLWDYSHFCL